jgi:cell division control protein 45
VFVFDSHRPLDLENTRSDNRDVLVLRDEREGEEHFPEPDSDYGDSDDSDDDSDEDGSESDDGSEASDDENDGEGSESDAENDENDPRGANDPNDPEDPGGARGEKKRRRGGRSARREAKRLAAGVPSPRTRRLRRAQKQRERVAYYSRGSFYGRAAGLLMYDIAHDAHKDSLEKHFPLWLAIVSLTDQYAHQRVSHQTYTAGVMELATQVSNLPGADAPTTRVLDEGVVVKAFEDRRVQYSEEFRFAMLRHWSLYDAMTHSPYVATRMQTWREVGRASLHSLLAHLGLPLEACKQRYAHMSPEHVKQLAEKLEEHGPSHGLDDLKFWSFSFSHGFKLNVVASDVVHGVTALLEGLPSAAAGGVESGEKDAGDAGYAGASGASGSSRASDDSGSSAAFWRATKALSMTRWDELDAGIQHAMRTQKALMRQGGLALANKAVIRTVGGLRYFSLLDHGSPADAGFFKHPLSLLRLALFLQDALRVVKKIERPLVVVGAAPGSRGGSRDAAQGGMALVVGVTGKPRQDDTTGGNHFAHSFRRAAEHVKARFTHDAFEASVLKVAERDLGEFMEALSDIDAERVARERMHAAADE